MSDSFTEVEFEYKLPSNFDSDNPEFKIFQNLGKEKCSKPEIKTLKNVRISNNSIVFNYFKIFKESCVNSWQFENKKFFRKFFLKFIFPQINFSKKRFLLITDEWTSNYYHWHIFALKKLLILKKNDLLEDSYLLLPKRYTKYKFVLPSLEKLGVKKEQIVYLRRKSNIKVAEVPLIIVSQQHPKIFLELQQQLLQNTKTMDLGFGDKIYISREGQVLRYVENEKETVELLEKYGFKKVILEKFSYEEQINICRKAKQIVAPHGAGLTNILFAANNSSLLEMASKPDMTKPVTDYYKLAQMLGIKYFYQECARGGKVRDFHQGSLIVDLKKLEENLKLMLQ